MKIIIASDIHGSAHAARALVQRVETEQAERILLLGDLLYHGPRNALPRDYDPAAVAAILNERTAITTAVKGNCEAEVDQWMLDFPCEAAYALIVDGKRTLFATHGHRPRMAPDEPPALPEGSAFLFGHTHVKLLERRGGIAFVNPGSVALPKDDSASYAVYEDGAFELKALDDGALLARLDLDNAREEPEP